MKTSKKNVDKEYKIAYDFATKTYKKFQQIIKSIVLFGSTSKHTSKKKSDIDLIIIVDDCVVNWDQELIAWYRAELSKLVEAQKYSEKIHLTTVTLSSFWDQIKAGEPMVMNVLRYGEALVDFGGFFEPLKVLLARGRIRPSPEAVFTLMSRAHDHLWKANKEILAAVESNHWATVDAAHAALMAEHLVPPSPEHVSEMLTKHFVKKKFLDKKWVQYYEKLRKLNKEITHGEKSHLTEREYKEVMKKSHDFVQVLTKLSKTLIKDERIIKPIHKNL